MEQKQDKKQENDPMETTKESCFSEKVDYVVDRLDSCHPKEKVVLENKAKAFFLGEQCDRTRNVDDSNMGKKEE